MYNVENPVTGAGAAISGILGFINPIFFALSAFMFLIIFFRFIRLLIKERSKG